MTETKPQVKNQLPANVTALHRQLEEMAARTKGSRSTTDRRQEVQGPVLVIRGK
jgi:hypothetical protein